MKLRRFYEAAIAFGMERDPRGPAELKRLLAAERKRAKDLPAREKQYFDAERLSHPYTDSRLLYGDPETEVRRLLVGVDMEIGEMLLADRLRQRGRGPDLVVAHHPEGRAMAAFYEVMAMQADFFQSLGVPIVAAEQTLRERMDEVGRRVLPANHARAVDAARLLDIPLVCLHTPADNHVHAYLQALCDRRAPRTLEDLLEVLDTVPEYRQASREGAAPRIIAGEAVGRAGRIVVDMTGGTEGPRPILEKLAAAGVGTLVLMHMSEDHLKEAKKRHLNVVIAGHISSDTLGLNLLLDRLQKLGRLEISEASGFKRVTAAERQGAASK